MTSTSTASVFYGLHVRTADLIAAGEAFKLISPTLDALDLVEHRIDNGTLRTSTSPTPPIAQVPREVWDEIRSVMIASAVAEAREAFLERVYCRCHECACKILHLWLSQHQAAKTGKPLTDPVKWSTMAEVFELKSERCNQATLTHWQVADRERGAYQGMHAWDADWIDRSQEVVCPNGLRKACWRVFWETAAAVVGDLRQLLGRYGLRLLGPMLIQKSQFDCAQFSQLTTPLASSISDHNSKEDNLPLEYLHPPSNAATPFARFCRAFAVQPVDSNTRAPTSCLEPAVHSIA